MCYLKLGEARLPGEMELLVSEEEEDACLLSVAFKASCPSLPCFSSLTPICSLLFPFFCIHHPVPHLQLNLNQNLLIFHTLRPVSSSLTCLSYVSRLTDLTRFLLLQLLLFVSPLPASLLGSPCRGIGSSKIPPGQTPHPLLLSPLRITQQHEGASLFRSA